MAYPTIFLDTNPLKNYTVNKSNSLKPLCATIQAT